MRFVRPRFIPKGSTKVSAKIGEAVAYLYEKEVAGKQVYSAVMYVGRAEKPTWHYRFNTPAKREAKIAETFANVVAHLERTAARRAERKAIPNNYKVGDVFCASWGYDQTNVDYFEAVEVKGKYVTVRAINKVYVETGNMSGNATPLPGSFATELTKRCLVNGGWGLKIDECRTASLVKPEKMIGTVPVYGSHYESHYA